MKSLVFLLGLSLLLRTSSSGSCPNGKVFDQCGSPCALNCDNYAERDTLNCITVCEEGCFCPVGMVELGSGCVHPADCPSYRDCPDGKVFDQCGSPCALNCDNYAERDTIICATVCEEGCFCPVGMVELGSGCVLPADCPSYRAECNGEQCPRYSSCHTDNSTGQSTCVPDCQVLNGGCPADQACRLVTSHDVQEGSDDSDDDLDGHDGDDGDGDDGDGLDGDGDGGGLDGDGGGGSDDDGGNNGGRGGSDGHGGGGGGGRRGRRQSNIDGDGSGDDDDDNHLPNNYYINCIAVPYVLCDNNNFLACDSEFLYCLQHNITRRGSCVPSCLSANGGCRESQECITTYEDQVTRLECLDRSDLSTECPAGQVINQCGDLCQETCEQRVSGEQFACIEICAPPACVCPPGLLRFRDRCVDPRLCYVLLQYPPAIDPLPLVDDNQFLYSLFSPGSSISDFLEELFLQAVEEILANEGFDDVTVELHGIYEDHGLYIVLVLSCEDGATLPTPAEFINLVEEDSHQLPLPIKEVQVVDVDRVDSGFWTTSRIALVSAGGVALLLIVVSMSVVVVIAAVLCVKRSGKKFSKMHPEDIKMKVVTATKREKKQFV